MVPVIAVQNVALMICCVYKKYLYKIQLLKPDLKAVCLEYAVCLD